MYRKIIKSCSVKSNLNIVRKIFGSFNKRTLKIDLDIVRTRFYAKFFSPSIALYRGPTVSKKMLRRKIYFIQNISAPKINTEFAPETKKTHKF
jgi:hypothetical protein